MRAAILVSAMLLAGCGGAESEGRDSQVEPANLSEAAPAPRTAPPARSEPVLTAEGFGPLRIGMTRAEVVAALGEDDDSEAVGGPDPESCDEFRPARAPAGLLVMIEAGRLTRISLVDGSTVKTDRGLGLGATAAAVRAAYGPALQAEPHKYEDAPAEYLSVWAKDAPKDEKSPAPETARGIVYEVGSKGVVQAISGGGPSILYVEGCGYGVDRSGTAVGSTSFESANSSKHKEGSSTCAKMASFSTAAGEPVSGRRGIETTLVLTWRSTNARMSLAMSR